LDCVRGKTIGWYIGNRSAKTFKEFYERFKDLDAIFYTDDWDVYSQIIPPYKHIIGKKYTIEIEQNNSNVRHFLGRMTRRTKVVTKSVEMLDITLKICWYINEQNSFKYFQNIFYLSLDNNILYFRRLTFKKANFKKISY